MKSLLSISAVLALLAAACSTSGAESDAVFTPFPGLECRTDQYWGEYGSIGDDAEGLATPSAAIEAGMVRWMDREDGEVALIDDLEEASTVVGALVVGGSRVVLTFPEAAPAGGWLTVTTVGCEGYEP